MNTFPDLQRTAQAYVLAVVVLGAAVLTFSVSRLYTSPLDQQFLILAALTLLTGSFSVKVSSINAYISVSEPFVFASVLLFGVDAGTLTVLLESLTILFWMRPNGRPLYRVIFNLAAPALAISLSGHTFFLISRTEPYAHAAAPAPTLPQLLLPLFAFTAVYFLLNSWLVAIAVGLENHKSPTQIWWRNFAWLSVNYLTGASIAALIVTYTRRLELSSLVIIVPFLIVSYLTFRTAMGRAEDSYNHVTQLNRLYLSTIETLAMAIDAKDQITHGHIRRVQTYAVGLAKRIGIADDKLIKAVEAAALLHDMGKLAVPEYILNKPGKLTPAEFEKMKLHASIGADILSAIDFPYPVVPIVRHHHESWDGSGYPDGLRGTDIPIGARILSVVDCFDALTSDRPYRPRLSDGDAIAILQDRRGSMYDPLIVDTFVRVHSDIAPHQDPTEVPVHVFNEITSSAQTTASAQTVSRPDASDVVFNENTVDQDIIAAALQAATDTLRLTTPVTQATFHYYDVETDGLVLSWAWGFPIDPGIQARTLLGHKLSGWVAANRQAVANSDPHLELGELATTLSLRSCFAMPIVTNETLVGVYSLYSGAENAFIDAGTRANVVMRKISPLLGAFAPLPAVHV
jgi:putative nucleotidyltransferase with HDIG domain